MALKPACLPGYDQLVQGCVAVHLVVKVTIKRHALLPDLGASRRPAKCVQAHHLQLAAHLNACLHCCMRVVWCVHLL